MLIIPRMRCENTGLATFNNNTAELFFKWMNESSIYTFMGDIDPFPFTEEDARKYVESHKKDTYLIIANNKNMWHPIGYTGLFIRRRHRIGIFRIAITEEKYLGQGHAHRATKMMVDWAFNECDLISVHLSVSERNIKAIKLYKSVGFIHCGTFADSRFENGIRTNEILMEYTIEMYRKSKTTRRKIWDIKYT